MYLERKGEKRMVLRTVVDEPEHVGLCLDGEGEQAGGRGLRRRVHAALRGSLGGVLARINRAHVFVGAAAEDVLHRVGLD